MTGLRRCKTNSRALQRCRAEPRAMLSCAPFEPPANIWCVLHVNNPSHDFGVAGGCGLSVVQYQNSTVPVAGAPSPLLGMGPVGLSIRPGACAGRPFEDDSQGVPTVCGFEYLNCSYLSWGQTAIACMRFRLETYRLPGEDFDRTSIVGTAQFSVAGKRGVLPDEWDSPGAYSMQNDECCAPFDRPPNQVLWNPFAAYNYGYSRVSYMEPPVADEESKWVSLGQVIVRAYIPSWDSPENTPDPITGPVFDDAFKYVIYNRATTAMNRSGFTGLANDGTYGFVTTVKQATVFSTHYIPVSAFADDDGFGNWIVTTRGADVPQSSVSGYRCPPGVDVPPCVDMTTLCCPPDPPPNCYNRSEVGVDQEEAVLQFGW